MDSARRTHLLTSLPDWILAVLLAWAAARFLELAWWLAAALAAGWIVKDLLLFPRMRRYYEPEPAERRLVGQSGVALTAIDPHGFVRVHGEIWQADLPSDHGAIGAGAAIRVRDVRGLRLTVQAGERSA
jgi:membrane protein implicated in regulation of membrane protease activity